MGELTQQFTTPEVVTTTHSRAKNTIAVFLVFSMIDCTDCLTGVCLLHARTITWTSTCASHGRMTGCDPSLTGTRCSWSADAASSTDSGRPTSTS